MSGLLDRGTSCEVVPCAALAVEVLWFCNPMTGLNGRLPVCPAHLAEFREDHLL